MASASPQRCYPQLVVKFKSATQKALCSFTRANELNQEEGHSSKYSVKEHFYRGLPFAQRSRGPPLTCEQSRQADLQPRLQGSTLTLRHTGGRASLPDSASPFLPSQTAHRVEHFILKSYWQVSIKTPIYLCYKWPKLNQGAMPHDSSSSKNHRVTKICANHSLNSEPRGEPQQRKGLHHKVLEEFKILPARHTWQTGMIQLLK